MSGHLYTMTIAAAFSRVAVIERLLYKLLIESPTNTKVLLFSALAVPPLPPPPLTYPDPKLLHDAQNLLQSAQKPLVIIGKGARDASRDLTQFIDLTQLPFLPTPMGKGIVSDTHSCCVASARSQ